MREKKLLKGLALKVLVIHMNMFWINTHVRIRSLRLPTVVSFALPKSTHTHLINQITCDSGIRIYVGS